MLINRSIPHQMSDRGNSTSKERFSLIGYSSTIGVTLGYQNVT